MAAASAQVQAPGAASFALVPGDVIEAVVVNTGGPRLKVTLTPQKSGELAAFTGRNLNRQVKIVVCGKLRAEPFIQQQMSGPTMEIFVRSPDEALETIHCLLTANVSFNQLHKWVDSSGQTHYAEKPPAGAGDPPAAVAAVADGPKALQELQTLQGTWLVAQNTVNGRPDGDDSLLGGIWVFKGSELTMQSPKKGKGRFKIKLDVTGQTKAFHLSPLAPPTEVSGWMLFAREGENLKLAFFDNLSGRPTGFEPVEGRPKPVLVVVTLTPER